MTMTVSSLRVAVRLIPVLEHITEIFFMESMHVVHKNKNSHATCCFVLLLSENLGHASLGGNKLSSTRVSRVSSSGLALLLERLPVG